MAVILLNLTNRTHPYSGTSASYGADFLLLTAILFLYPQGGNRKIMKIPVSELRFKDVLIEDGKEKIVRMCLMLASDPPKYEVRFFEHPLRLFPEESLVEIKYREID